MWGGPRIAAAIGCSDLKVPTTLAKWWREDQIYFRPTKGLVSPIWGGTAYLRDSKTCCVLKEADDGLVSKPVKCSAQIKSLAAVRPVHIKDFSVFKRTFSGCLQKRDRACLKSLMAFQVRTGFGFDVYGDLREQALHKWGSAGLSRMEKLLKKGVVGSGARRSFPPAPDKKGLGWRGTFVLGDDGWVLESFLQGQ